MDEQLPLATIHGAVLGFLRGRDDAMLFGAQAVNAYIDEPRMTQDVDILSPVAVEFAEELRTFLSAKFVIAVRIRIVAGGAGLRLYQLRKPANRHLVDVRKVDRLPAGSRVEEILVPDPPVLISQKILSFINRPNTRKGFMDAADLRGMLLAFPELKTAEGQVADELRAVDAPHSAWDAWREIVEQEILPDDDESGY